MSMTSPKTTRPSEKLIDEALQHANLNALRIALYHETADPELLDMEIVRLPVRGGAFTAHSIARKHHDELRAKAKAYLLSGASPQDPPTKREASRLMRAFTGEEVTQAQVDYGWEELAFDPLARSASWHSKPSETQIAEFEVTIIGAGVSGIMMGIQLDRLGIPWRIIERHEDIGGTWHVNDYPEARVDISTFLYQFNFETNYPWSSFFATQGEIKNYLKHIIDKYGLRDRIELSTNLKGARWDEESQRWVLDIVRADGSEEVRECNAIVSASGLFSTANLPDIPGIETFQGKMFHTTQWDHDYDYAGKRVVLIGTGSTGVQLMPEIAEKAGHLSVFQRTANWITPAPGYRAKVSPAQRWLLDTMPGYWNWFIYSIYIGEKQIQELQVMDPNWIAQGGKVNEKNARLADALTDYIRERIGDDEELIAKLIPDHPPVSRRLVIDNGWYDALVRDNVELVTCGIDRIVDDGLIDTEGHHHPADLIILGAGFKVSEYLWPAEYEGRDGITPAKLWAKDGARAYFGSVMPKFPNFFMFYGPNSQARAGGFHSWAEIWSRYIARLLVAMIEQGIASIEVKQEVFDDYNKRMDREVKTLLWEHEGQEGYYVNEHGRSGVNMPWTMHDFYEMISNAGLEDYRTVTIKQTEAAE